MDRSNRGPRDSRLHGRTWPVEHLRQGPSPAAARWLWRHKRAIAAGVALGAGAYGAYVVYRKKRPELPSGAQAGSLARAGALIALMRRCWSSEPKRRPSFASIVEQLKPQVGGRYTHLKIKVKIKHFTKLKSNIFKHSLDRKISKIQKKN